jgi:hypothetical protein
MKKIFLLASVALCFAACEKDCSNSEQTKCMETPPTNEACLAYFQSWFYNSSTNSCEQIGYSGCSPKGFQTKEECESCKCND